MYVILVNEDNTMTATIRDRIVQRSKLVDSMCFLVHPMYKGLDMSSATVLMEYVLPASKRYRTEILTRANELHKGHLKYTLPFDTKLTEEAGEIEVNLSFIYVDMDITGQPVQRVRKTAPAHKITIVPVSAWSDIIPDSTLSAIDQRIIKVDAQIRAMEDMNRVIVENKADNLRYNEESNELQLLAGDKGIGDVIRIKECKGVGEDGVPIVDFSNIKEPEPELPDEYDNVIEF